MKLLHVLEENKIRPVGSEKERNVDVRIISATNKDLDEMAENQSFRKDLYFRINVFNIHVPSLKERKEDIVGLISFFMKKEGKRLTPPSEISMEADVEELLLAHEWPGNVRELENVIGRAVTMAEDCKVAVSDLPTYLTKMQPTNTPSAFALRDQVRVFEINTIKQTIGEFDGDRKFAAQKLQIGLSTLYRKLEEFE